MASPERPPRRSPPRAPGHRRVAVTGIGVVTPLGTGREQLWRALLAGESGISPVTSFDTSRFKVHLGAEVRGFDPGPWLQRLDASDVGRASQMAIAAARLALADAGLDAYALDPERSGVAMGTTSGEPVEIEIFNDALRAGGSESLDGALATRYPCHRIPGQIAAELGLAGPNVMLPNACAAGNYAVA